MIEPDRREVFFYDVNNILMLEPDMVPHYFTILFNKMQMLDDGEKLSTCFNCGSILIDEIKEKKNKVLICLDCRTKGSDNIILETIQQTLDRKIKEANLAKIYK